jgi:hypothetical protein
LLARTSTSSPSGGGLAHVGQVQRGQLGAAAHQGQAEHQQHPVPGALDGGRVAAGDQRAQRLDNDRRGLFRPAAGVGQLAPVAADDQPGRRGVGPGLAGGPVPGGNCRQGLLQGGDPETDPGQFGRVLGQRLGRPLAAVGAAGVGRHGAGQPTPGVLAHVVINATGRGESAWSRGRLLVDELSAAGPVGDRHERGFWPPVRQVIGG